MKIRSLLFTGILGLVIAVTALASLPFSQPTPVAAAPAGQSGDYITVVVKEGDSLVTYVRLYGVSGEALIAANPQVLKDPNKIFPGQTLVIPVIRSFTPSLTTPFYYTVQAGDNIYAIGRRFHMDATVIAWANGITNNIVILGKTYLIPAGPHYHIVQKGETLSTIGALYGIAMEALQTFNDIPNPYVLYIGQYVFIPIVYNASPLAIVEPTAAPTNTPTATLPAASVPNATATRTFTPTAGPTATPTQRVNTATPVPTATPNLTPSAGNYIQTVVHAGENLVIYTYRYGVTGGALLAANTQLKDPGKLYPGDVINIPIVASFTPSRSTPFFYTLTAGDSLFTVAAKFEILPDLITRANPGVTPAAGVTLLIPAGPHVYTVKAGDEIRTIAAKYGTTVEFILSGNDLPNPDRIYLDQQIFIPIRYGAAPVPYTP